MAALLLSACSPAAPPLQQATSALPDGVTVSVYQTRADVVARALEVRVTNGSAEDLVVTGAEFDSAQFADAAVWEKDSTVLRAGRTVDLPVRLAAPECEDLAPAPLVRLTFEIGDEVRVAEVSPDDELDRLPALRAEECFEQTVAGVAELRAETAPRISTVAGQLVAQLDLTIAPSGSGSGTITVDSAAGTTLFSVLDQVTGATMAPLPIGRSVPDGEPVLTLTLVPNRCDPHAVAEDKRGTLFPLTVTAPDEASASGVASGIVYVPAATAVKEALIAYIGLACGTSPG